MVRTVAGDDSFCSQKVNVIVERASGEAGICFEACLDDGFVFLGLEGAGGVEKTAGWQESGKRGGKNSDLSRLLACDVVCVYAEADFGIAADCTSAGAGNVAEDQVVVGLQLHFGGVMRVQLKVFSRRPKDSAHGFESAFADIPCGDCSDRVAFRKNSCLDAGSGTGVENPGARAGEFSNELRTFVLNADSALQECAAADDVSR